MAAARLFVRSKMARRMLRYFTATVGAKPCLELPFHIVNRHLCSGSLLTQGPEGVQYSVQVIKRYHKIYLADGCRLFQVENVIEKGDLVEIEIIDTKRMQSMFSTKNNDKHTDSYDKHTDSSTNRVAMNIADTGFKEMPSSKAGRDKTLGKIRHEIEAAKERLKNPSDIMKFTATKLESSCKLPREFAANISAQHGSMVDITVSGGKSKQVRWLFTSRFQGLGTGWRELVKLHGIKLGDMALLELTSQNAITFHIYNCSETKTELAKSLKQEAQRYSKKLSKPSISVEVTKQRFETRLNFGTAFIRKHMLGLEYGDYVTFSCLDGCSHEIRWTRISGFSAGWRAFKRNHDLKMGDVLVLEVLGPKNLKVHLFRLQRENCPDV